ncbi:carboxypeptidase regulatory-like domain-containing protein [Deinococcus aerius]|uniref:Carboxypeptidase regulatory-like domain-containing protein n=1 Tax=Deinococcus aerius TaxID=200253 RepID=A0A2I9D1D9_9DEIO|nr:carboxypeptidase-like regulatory domain-containing protein [Deinococcus aerius]GBF03830.1 carboxypeptidase regulatory-like domain-containing protein [Deinococcus aerius]
MNKRSLLAAALSLLLAGCTTGADGTGRPPTPAPNPAPRPAQAHTMSGTVRNSAGQPVAGATVFAGHTVYFNTNVLAKTGADGTYRLSVREPAGSWYAGGTVEASLDGQRYTFDLLPSSSEPFPGAQGAVRDFTWRLTGERPDGQKIGATVTVYADFFDPGLLDWLPDIELTLTPTGPRIDGSPGVEVRGRIEQTPDGQEGLEDIALGRYAISARYAPAGGPSQTLQIRRRNQGEFAPTVASRFVQRGSGQIMEVEVSRQP